ncbi:hypothetical protein [Nakamurella antarctica]|uniref:hypothetical protein n=1 Tax=Nakamurella antarctica TaxID=1902245 RepID=UPI001EF0CD1C|nr:hypothetical protein [Nakamurella antarctica]
MTNEWPGSNAGADNPSATSLYLSETSERAEDLMALIALGDQPAFGRLYDLMSPVCLGWPAGLCGTLPRPKK